VNLRPTQNLFFMAAEMFSDLWDIRLNGSKQEAVSIKAEIRKIEGKVGQFLDRIVETDSHTLISTYENQVRKLEEGKILLQEKIQNCGRPLQSFDDTFRIAMTFLANPKNLWASERIEDKRSVLKLVFAEKLPYCRKDGFRTARISLPFSLLKGLKGGKNEMVRGDGIEPPTRGFSVLCSTD
jgi:site-specific DNA recombinase